MTPPTKQEPLQSVKLTMTEQLLKQYVALSQLRQSQVEQMTYLVKKTVRHNHRLIGMLVASLIVNTYLIFRFF